jgi:hypothetical protein
MNFKYFLQSTGRARQKKFAVMDQNMGVLFSGTASGLNAITILSADGKRLIGRSSWLKNGIRHIFSNELVFKDASGNVYLWVDPADERKDRPQARSKFNFTLNDGINYCGKETEVEHVLGFHTSSFGFGRPLNGPIPWVIYRTSDLGEQEFASLISAAVYYWYAHITE